MENRIKRVEPTCTHPVTYYQGNERPNMMACYSYHWQYIPTGETGTSTVWCYNTTDFYKLLNYWNTKSPDWKYWE